MSEAAQAIPEIGHSSISFVHEQRHEALREILDTVDRATATAGGGPEWFDVKLAVEEVCSNIMDHGYGPDRAGPIELSLRANDDQIVVSVRDNASPFDPEDAPAPDLESDWSDRRVGGLGWHLIKQIMDRLEYESSPDRGNELTLVKRRGQTREDR